MLERGFRNIPGQLPHEKLLSGLRGMDGAAVIMAGLGGDGWVVVGVEMPIGRALVVGVVVGLGDDDALVYRCAAAEPLASWAISRAVI